MAISKTALEAILVVVLATIVTCDSFGKLLVVGGNGAESKVELVDLSEEGEKRTCPSMPDYPGAAYGSMGTYISGRAMVCGGRTNGSTGTNSCYYYNRSNNLWVQTASMTHVRYYAAGVLLSPTEWWISGSSNPEFDSTELYSVNNNSFSSYTDLPEWKSYHNLIQINSTHFMLLGDEYNTSKAWMFDNSNQVWHPMPDLLQEGRARIHAGLVKYPNGRQAVIVAGSATPYPKTSEIFDLEEQIWKYGPNLPVEEQMWKYGPNLHLEYYSYGGASVQYKDSFLIIGGLNGSNYVNTIFTFDPLTEKWKELPQKLKMGRDSFAAFLVPEDFAQCT